MSFCIKPRVFIVMLTFCDVIFTSDTDKLLLESNLPPSLQGNELKAIINNYIHMLDPKNHNEGQIDTAFLEARKRSSYMEPTPFPSQFNSMSPHTEPQAPAPNIQYSSSQQRNPRQSPVVTTVANPNQPNMQIAIVAIPLPQPSQSQGTHQMNPASGYQAPKPPPQYFSQPAPNQASFQPPPMQYRPQAPPPPPPMQYQQQASPPYMQYPPHPPHPPIQYQSQSPYSPTQYQPQAPYTPTQYQPTPTYPRPQAPYPLQYQQPQRYPQYPNPRPFPSPQQGYPIGPLIGPYYFPRPPWLSPYSGPQSPYPPPQQSNVQNQSTSQPVLNAPTEATTPCPDENTISPRNADSPLPKQDSTDPQPSHPHHAPSLDPHTSAHTDPHAPPTTSTDPHVSTSNNTNSSHSDPQIKSHNHGSTPRPRKQKARSNSTDDSSDSDEDDDDDLDFKLIAKLLEVVKTKANISAVSLKDKRFGPYTNPDTFGGYTINHMMINVADYVRDILLKLAKKA